MQYIYNKKHKIVTVLILLVFAVTSCQKTFLDATSEATISDVNAIVDSSSAYNALTGVYDGLQNSDYYGGDGFAAAAFLSGGDGLWVGTLNYYNNFTQHTYSADNTLLYRIWSTIYSVVNRANNVITKVPALSTQQLSTASKNTYVGEAYFIRALAFFDLARLWGNVPLVEIPVSDVSDVTGIKQSTRSEVFTKVVADLENAVTLLPSGVNRNRITQNTAYAFLARVYLYQENWEKAEEYASKIINNNNYSLVSWSTILSGTKTNESIFELVFSSSDQSAHYGTWSSVNYRNQLCPNKGLYTLLHTDSIGGLRSALVTDNSSSAVSNYYVQNLYWRTDGSNPTYVFRLAEQYLIREEARARKSSPDISGAYADLNSVRARAGISNRSISSINFLLNDILQERRVEFALEPQRWFDLIRFGKTADVSVSDANKLIYPIPYNDLQADGDLVQNPGY